MSIPTPPSTPIEEKKRAIVICKRTRWNYEAHRLSHTDIPLNDNELEAVLLSKNIDPIPLKVKDYEQRMAEQEIIDQLKEIDMRVILIPLSSLPLSLPSSSIIITAGGDGTFLAAASLVNDNTPLIGINTDPNGSEGHLCVGGKNPPKDLIKAIVSDDTKWCLRSRIKVTIHNGKSQYEEPLLALNEVFVGESDSAKVSYYDISIDGSPSQRQKSSGFVACSGSGSSAWYTSINRVLPSTVESVIDALRSLGLSLPSHSNLIDNVSNIINNSLSESPDCKDILFCVREPIFNKTFAPSPCRGRAKRISLRSRCSNAVLVLDGSRQVPFNYNTVVTLEIDKSFALRTLV